MTTNQKPNKPFEPAKLLLILVPAIFIIAVSVFLSTKDGIGEHQITGWEALKRQWPSFWVWVGVGTVLAAAFGALAYFNESGAGWLGRLLPGRTGLTVLFVLLALGFLCGPWGKACTDKTNGGLTLPAEVSTHTSITESGARS